MRRSTKDIAWFWDAILKELRIEFSKPYQRVLDLSGGIAWPKWCVGGTMNIVSNCLDKYAGTAIDAHVAIRWEGEDGQVRVMSYRQLRGEVNRAASALRSLGVGRGDVIGVFMPMIPETVAAMLAIIKIGAIFLPLFSGFGPAAVAQRLTDGQARAVFAADGCTRRGKLIPLKSVADVAVSLAPSVRHVIVVRRSASEVKWNPARDHWWHELVDRQSDQAETLQTDADETMMILYTSGTTGRPKGAVHTHCGFPIKAAQDILQGLDLHEDEVLFWATDMGWMMGPWLVFGTLLLGATMILYDGALDWPGPGRLWSLVENHRITALGISPTLVRALLPHGAEPVRRHDLSSLRKFASTGEPWNPEPWRWLFDVVGRGRLPIINYSGGTEIAGGILMGNVLTPLKPCAFAGPVPGMDADVVDESGRSVRGQVGELVIRQPWIGMTRGFWNDSRRYLDTYWSRFPDIWVHGDWAAIDADGQWYILGRSDDTIKIAGKRLGPAEVESILVAHPSVREAAAIGVPDPLKGQALVCFCILKPGIEAGEILEEELKARITGELGKAFAPRAIKFVPDLPRTRNAKMIRRIIRATFLGEDPGDVSALENPQAIDGIRSASPRLQAVEKRKRGKRKRDKYI